MPKHILVAIGGTGIRFAEAFIHLAASGAVDAGEYELCFVDMDFENGDYTRCSNALRHYEEARKALNGSGADNGSGAEFMKAELSLIKKEGRPTAWKLDDHMSSLLRATYDDKTTVKDLARRDRAGETLLDFFMDKGELTRPLKKGFYGHPAVGAAVISAMFESEAFDESNPIVQTIQNNITENIQITLVASSFGATGASIFPNLAAKLRKVHMENISNAKGTLTINGVLALPYHKLPPAQNERNSVDAGEYLNESISILDYYNRSIPDKIQNSFNRLYFAGSDDLNRLNSAGYSLGGSNQKHVFMPTELVGALLIRDSFQQPNGAGRYFYYNKGADTAYIAFPEDVTKRLGVFTEFALAMEEYFWPHLLSLEDEAESCASQRNDFLHMFRKIYPMRDMRTCQSDVGILQDISQMIQAYRSARLYFTDYFSFMRDIHRTMTETFAFAENQELRILRVGKENKTNNFTPEYERLYEGEAWLKNDEQTCSNKESFRQNSPLIYNTVSMNVRDYDTQWRNSLLSEGTAEVALEALREYAKAAYLEANHNRKRDRMNGGHTKQ